MPDDNPFLRPSDLAYQLPPFDRITDAHYGPAIRQGMAEQRAEIEAIAADPEPPTVENTLVALERSGDLLGRVMPAFHNAAASLTNPAVQELEQELAPELAGHTDAIYLHPQLYQRVRALHQQRDQLDLDPETTWLLERCHTRFVRAGAELSPADQDRLREINQELSGLQAAFRSRLLADSNELAVTGSDPDQLAGLSGDAVAAAVEAARERGSDGYVLALKLPSNQPALAGLHDRALRERLHQAATSRGTRGNGHDTRELVREMVALRAERARLFGYPHHAGYEIADRTAGSLAAVDEMLARLVPPAVANVTAEAEQLAEEIRADGETFPLAPWDWSYYADRIRASKYDVDVAEVRPYLSLDRVLTDGVFFAAGQLYGLRFAARDDLPTYHPEVRVYEVFEADGTPLGLFLADFFARDSKRGGAWAMSYVAQSRLRGTRPVVGVHLNIGRPPAGEPALLTMDEVRTLFHEFGHALHALFSDVHYPRFAGTNVPRDFVEYPSQVNEMWLLWPEVVSNYARHYQTGEPMPAGLLERLRAAERWGAGFRIAEYLAAAVLDLAWHRLSPEQAAAVTDVLEFEAAALAEAGLDLPAVPPRYRTGYFNHVFGTEMYSAGYYSYIWSEVLDADTVEWFRERGGLRRENGDAFRAKLLSRGGSGDAMAAFRALRGRDPSLQPLLVRRGLVNEGAGVGG